MATSEQIHNYTIKDILRILDQEYRESGIYVDIQTSFTENPLKYPYRNENYTLLFVTQGFITVQINLIEYRLEENTITIIPPQMVILFKEFSQDINFIAVSFNRAFAIENTHTQNEKSTFVLLTPNTVSKLILNKEQQITLLNLCTLLDDKNKQKSKSTNQKEAIKHLFALLLLELVDASHYNYKELKSNLSCKESLTIAFLELLQVHFKTEKLIRFYAEKLNVSESYLAKVIKEITAKTIGELIDDTIIVEAQLLLANSTLSVSEIAETLNFNNTSFFVKFFKRKVGCSPRAYKKLI
jgi:AraC-like DNA-binding protein